MRVILAKNVNDALPQGIALLNDCGIRRPSRNGEILEVPVPVTTHYMRPWERVLFDPIRDANPYFHFFEALWMLAGRRDLKFLAQFNRQMAEYSDNGRTLRAAYGYRWRNHFLRDQVNAVIRRLCADPNDRRSVISMWDTRKDFDVVSKDIPCNMNVAFRLRGGYLGMTVSNRSNDMLWGAYGANIVHMSMLQELVAGCLRVDIGSYWQVSNSFHVYTDNAVWKRCWNRMVVPEDFYETAVRAFPLITSWTHDPIDTLRRFDLDLKLFLKNPDTNGTENEIFRKIAKPMWYSHAAYREKDFKGAREILEQMPADNDWRLACETWIANRYAHHLTRL